MSQHVMLNKYLRTREGRTSKIRGVCMQGNKHCAYCCTPGVCPVVWYTHAGAVQFTIFFDSFITVTGLTSSSFSPIANVLFTP